MMDDDDDGDDNDDDDDDDGVPPLGRCATGAGAPPCLVRRQGASLPLWQNAQGEARIVIVIITIVVHHRRPSSSSSIIMTTVVVVVAPPGPRGPGAKSSATRPDGPSPLS